MANGKFTLGKQSGGTLGLVFPDGVSNTEVVLPESGELATKEYVDTGAGVAFVANDTRVKTALNADGTAPIYACRAWVNFNGTGTVAIRASGNVSSITDNGVGDFTINFTTALPDANYSSTICISRDGMPQGNVHNVPVAESLLSTSFRLVSYAGGTYNYGDHTITSVSIFR